MGLLAEGVHEIGIVDGDVVLICSSYGLGDVLLYLLWCEYGLSALSPPPLQGDRCPIPLGVPSLNGPLSSSDTVARRKGREGVTSVSSTGLEEDLVLEGKRARDHVYGCAEGEKVYAARRDGSATIPKNVRFCLRTGSFAIESRDKLEG